jgi:hypothetical protein
MKPLNPLKGTLASVILFNFSSLVQNHFIDEHLSRCSLEILNTPFREMEGL